MYQYTMRTPLRIFAATCFLLQLLMLCQSYPSPMKTGPMESKPIFSQYSSQRVSRPIPLSRPSVSAENKSLRKDTRMAPLIFNRPIKESRSTSFLGLIFGSIVVVGLSGTSNQEATGTLISTLPLFDAVSNVVDATVPTSSTDFVAGTLGEAIAGIIGASTSAILQAVASKNRKPLVAEALADSDYFIAQAGLAPTLQAVGMPPFLASLGSVVVASVPSQLVKLSSKKKERRKEEDVSLQSLLEEERERQQKQKTNQFMQTVLSLREVRPNIRPQRVDPKDLYPITDAKTDFVEVFSDVTRWLGYNVLKNDYGDLVVFNGHTAGPGLSGAILGFVAAFSSRLYGDILYGAFRYGPEVMQREVQTRRPVDWVANYLSTSFAAAALFGVYEMSQLPISRWIQGILAGGVDGCLGSDSFEICFDAYIEANAPGASPEAQFRALATNLVMVTQRLQDVAVDTNSDDIETLARAWYVSAYSYIQLLAEGIH